MTDPRGQIDISLALIGAESTGLVGQLIARLGELDNRLKSMAIDGLNTEQQAAVSRQIAGVVQTGSTSLPDPMRGPSPSPYSYRVESARSVSPVSDSQRNARERLGESAPTPGATQARIPYAQIVSRAGRFTPEDLISGGRSDAPDWLTKNVHNFEKPLEMPRYGEYTVQDKFNFAAAAASRAALKRTQAQEDAVAKARTDAADAAAKAHEDEFYQSYIDNNMNPRLVDIERMRTEAQAAGETAAQGVPSVDYNKVGGRMGSAAGMFASAASAAAGASLARPYAMGAFHHLAGTGDLQQTTVFDPRLFSPVHDILHMPSVAKELQALGQEGGFQAGNENFNLANFRNVQHPWQAIHSQAGLEGMDIVGQALDMHHRYSRVPIAEAAQFQADIVNEGYSGSQRDALLHMGSSVMQNTGLSSTVLAPMFADAARYGTTNLKDFSDVLNGIPDAARRAGMGTKAYAEALHQFANDAVANRGAFFGNAAAQGMDISSTFGIPVTEANALANNSGVQAFTMMQTGMLPGMQGNLPGAAITHGSEAYARMLYNSTAGFARPVTTNLGAYGSVTQSGAEAHYAAMSMATNGQISASQFKNLLNPDNTRANRANALGAIRAFRDPSFSHSNNHETAAQILNTAAKQGLLGTGSKERFREHWLENIKDPKERMRQLAAAITPNHSNNNLPHVDLKISLTREFEKYFHLDIGKSSKWVHFSQIARAGGGPSAAAGVEPTAAAIGHPGR